MHVRQPYTESIATTFARTILIALVVGSTWTIVEMLFRGFPGSVAYAWFSRIVGVFWISFGGHWVEIAYLNYVRMRLPHSRSIEVLARLGVWYLGGCILLTAMVRCFILMGNSLPFQYSWWQGGLLFIVIECIVHSIWHQFGRGSFYDGRG